MNRSPVLILGIGNTLLSDEGVGVHAIRTLQGEEIPLGADLLDGGTGGFNLLDCFQNYSCIVIIDAMLDDRAPGMVTVTQPRFASDFPRVLSAHDIGLRDLLESATLLGALPRMFLVAVSIAAKQSLGTELSSEVQAAIDRVVEHVYAIVQREQTAHDKINEPDCAIG
ncbi:MAG TPA: hydrogenase maturation protease [Thermoguttaceae bacterium]|nr:hydrogenase maturation protease [Thermoguttaceae bacterium]